jgi:hypothetical protein
MTDSERSGPYACGIDRRDATVPYSIRSPSRLAGSAPPHCVKCGAPMELADRSAAAAYGRRYERWKFQCPRCKHIQAYTMGATDRDSSR